MAFKVTCRISELLTKYVIKVSFFPRKNNNPYSLAFMCIFSALLLRYFIKRLSLIIRVNIVLNRTVVVDSD